MEEKIESKKEDDQLFKKPAAKKKNLLPERGDGYEW